MDLMYNYTYPEYYNRCHACVFASNISVFVRVSPVCLYEYEDQVYNIAEGIDRYTCFNEDPRLGVDDGEEIDCKTHLSTDTFDCYRGCSGRPEISEGATIKLGFDTHCTYKINLRNKTAFEV